MMDNIQESHKETAKTLLSLADQNSVASQTTFFAQQNDTSPASILIRELHKKLIWHHSSKPSKKVKLFIQTPWSKYRVGYMCAKQKFCSKHLLPAPKKFAILIRKDALNHCFKNTSSQTTINRAVL